MTGYNLGQSQYKCDIPLDVVLSKQIYLPLKMAAQNVHTYHALGRHCRDSEAEVALACLPKETCVFQYESMSQMEAAAHGVADADVDVDEGGYCVFINVPESIVGRDREAVEIG